MTDPVTVLELQHVTKRFPGVVANDDISFDLRDGEIHCLLGENGAGKSTLMNIVFGLYQPDEGQISVRGRDVHFTSSADAIAAGIGMVHQHFQLIPVLTVTENVVLGLEPRKRGLLDLRAAADRIRELSDQYGIAVDPDALVADLSIGQQQRVELVKALYRDADILILDEPTAVLTPGEVDEFFAVTRSLVDQGRSIVFITHKLREVLAVADRITVLRHGRVVGSAEPSSATEASLAELMVGRDVSFQVDKQPSSSGVDVLRVRQLVAHDQRGIVALDGVDLTVRAGEIYGVAGVEGNGQRELVETLTGLHPVVSGTIEIGDTAVQGRSPRRISEMQVAHVPEDRHKHGIVDAFTVADNLVLNRYHRSPFAHHGVRDRDAIAANATAIVDRFDVRCPGIETPVGSLSGGNQQKVVIGRELTDDLQLLVVAQPTPRPRRGLHRIHPPSDRRPP